MFSKGLVYRGYKVMPYSTACGTPISNFEAGAHYRTIASSPLLKSCSCSMLFFPLMTSIPVCNLESFSSQIRHCCYCGLESLDRHVSCKAITDTSESASKDIPSVILCIDSPALIFFHPDPFCSSLLLSVFPSRSQLQRC